MGILLLRASLILLTLLGSLSGYGQLPQLRGTWISKAGDVLVIRDTLTKSGNANMLCTATEDELMALSLRGKLLSFQQRYYTSADNNQQLHVKRYDLAITHQTDSTLTVKPASVLAKKFFANRPAIQFVKQQYNVDRSLAFRKLIYHTTRCYGSCPVIDLEVTSNQNIYFNVEFSALAYYDASARKTDSLRSGQFAGRLPDSLYQRLLTILQTSNLRTLRFPERYGDDAPETTLIVYFNDQRKYLKSMFPPTIAQELITFLHQLPERVSLPRTAQKRNLEE